MSDPLNIVERDKLRKAWLEALRSGKYQQGQYRLKTPEGSYCCLGVFCEVANIELDTEGKYPKGQPHSYDVIRQKLGITQGDTDLLTNMNDELNCTFIQIADYLEKEVFND